MGVTESTSRLLGLWLVLALLLGTTGTSASAQTPDTCIEGFDMVEASSKLRPLDVLTNSASSALLAGTATGIPSARIVRRDSTGWHSVATRGFDVGSSTLVAIAGDKSKGRWAVGLARAKKLYQPISLRQLANGKWKSVWVPRSGDKNAILTDVAVRTKKAAWAVGYRFGAAGTHMPHVVRWDGQRWKALSPSLVAGERGMLTSVSSHWSGGTWIAGSATRSRVERPFIARRAGGKWKRADLPWTGQGSITAIMVEDKQYGWAVGYRVAADRLRPLVLRWNGQAWKGVAPPDLDEETLLIDVDIDDGDVVLTGSTWDPVGQRMRPIVARRQGGGWQVRELKGFVDDAMMSSIGGLTSQRGYIIARSNYASALVRTCDGTGVGAAVRKSARQDRRAELAAPSRRIIHDPEAEPAPRLGLAGAPQLSPKPASKAPVAIVERAAQAGLHTHGPTYGAIIRDFDGDGQKDAFIGAHGSRALLYLNDGGDFSVAPVEFAIADRHGCTATDVDGSGLPDIYCTFGGGGGNGLKSNELVLDPGGSDPRLSPGGGVRELLARGRAVEVFDYDNDGHKDIVVGNRAHRSDGLPSYNRIYRWTAPARFELVRDSGLPPTISVRSFDVADFDRDGRMDLLMVTHDPKASVNATTIRLYRNTPNGLKGVHGKRGIKSIGESDAELAGLDKDKYFDLIQLSKDRIRVSLQRNGKFVKVYERKLSRAGALAVGDADGDGDTDIFILRYKPEAAINDLILLNDGNGKSYSAYELPSSHGGGPDSVYAFDHDGNGMTDFLALNGGWTGVPGPIELFAFYPR